MDATKEKISSLPFVIVCDLSLGEFDDVWRVSSFNVQVTSFQVEARVVDR